MSGRNNAQPLEDAKFTGAEKRHRPALAAVQAPEHAANDDSNDPGAGQPAEQFGPLPHANDRRPRQARRELRPQTPALDVSGNPLLIISTVLPVRLATS